MCERVWVAAQTDAGFLSYIWTVAMNYECFCCKSSCWKISRSLGRGWGLSSEKHTQNSHSTHTNLVLSQHLIKSETAHTQTNLKQSEGLAGADCSSHYSSLCDSLPCSPHLSALYKELPYGRGSEAPWPLLTPLLRHWPPRLSSDSLGMGWILTPSHHSWGETFTQRSKVTFNNF